MNRLTMLLPILLLAALLALPAPGGAQPAYDFAAEQEELSVPGETVQQSDAAVLEALRNSRMQVTVSTVGFDIERDQVAQQTLQNMAQAGGGGYFTATDTGQLAEALGAAATGQTGFLGGKDRVVITSPQNGDTVGPNVDVTGTAEPGALIVLYTMVYAADTGEEIRKVPGSRGRTTATGEFKFRVSTPRVVFGDREMQLKYDIHAHLLRADTTSGPETVVTVYSPQP